MKLINLLVRLADRLWNGPKARFQSKLLTSLPEAKLRASSHDSHARIGAVKGFRSVDLASGAPQSDTPEALKAAACLAIMAGENQYGESNGDMELRQRYARYVLNDTGVTVDPVNQVTVVSGTSSALAAVLLATVDPGDQVLVFEPYFEGYAQAIAMARAEVVPVPMLEKDGEWRIDGAKLGSLVGHRTRAIILNSPHNPTGRVFTRAELASIAAVAEAHDLLVISDEIYARLVYAGKHLSIRSLPGMTARTVVIDGLSKTHSASGWRIGFILAPSSLTAQVRRIVAALGLSAPTPLVVASRAAFPQSGDIYAASLSAGLDAARLQLQAAGLRLAEALRAKGFVVSSPQGATYLLATHPQLTADFVRTDTHRPVVYPHERLAEILLQKFALKTTPGDAFFSHGGESYVRICFARSERTIDLAVQNLSQGDSHE